MPIGVSRKRDDRRRRVLRDERTADEEQGEAQGRRQARRRKSRYGSAARRRHQPTIVDLLPLTGRRFWGAVTLLCTLALLVGSAVWVTAELGTTDSLPAFQQNYFGLVARFTQWVSAALMMASAVVCFQIYLVRRHRRDDYRGHYAIWLWAALAWVAGSADAAASLSQGLSSLLLQQYGGSLASGGLSLAPRVAFAILLGGRLAWEMREHRPSMTLLLVALGAWVTASVVPLMITADVLALRLAAMADLVGAFGLTLASLAHARYVIVDAATGGRRVSRHAKAEGADEDGEDSEEADQGPTQRRQSRRRRAEPEVPADVEEEDSEELDDRSRNVAPSAKASRTRSSRHDDSADEDESTAGPSRPEPVHVTPAAQTAADEQDDDEDEGLDPSAMAGMSKAQRKKLARAQRRAARRGAA